MRVTKALRGPRGFAQLNMNSGYQIPVLDLDLVSDEVELLPIVRSILLNHDTFLLKNFASKGVLDELLELLRIEDAPELSQGFDSNFTGCMETEGNPDVVVEQYILNTDDTLQFDRDCDNVSLRKLYNRLFKITLFFAKLCLKSIDLDENLINEEQFGTKVTRYFNNAGEDNLHQVLPDGENFEYLFSRDFEPFTSTGIITIFPSATGIKCKPPSISVDDNKWVTVDQPDCLLLHTGTLLSKWSNGYHNTSPLKIDHQAGVTHLTMYPAFGTKVDLNRSDDTVGTMLFDQQIQEFPKIAEKFYMNQLAVQNLHKKIQFYKNLFTTCESILSLHVISRASGTSPELHSLLPQITNMMKKKVTQETFLRMLTLWPECYIIKASSRHELTVGVPRNDPLMVLTSKSRRLEFVELADKWFRENNLQKIVPSDVPMFKFNKRRASESTTDVGLQKQNCFQNIGSRNIAKPKYISNTKESFIYKEKEHTSQVDLLEKLRERERRSAAMLSQRQRQYQQFLAVKMTQVFEILFSLQWNRPYTATNLSTVIVDSLQDGNNPIGTAEAEEILLMLQKLLPDEISVHIVDGGLRVFRWDNLDRAKLQQTIANFRNESDDFSMD